MNRQKLHIYIYIYACVCMCVQTKTAANLVHNILGKLVTRQSRWGKERELVKIDATKIIQWLFMLHTYPRQRREQTWSKTACWLGKSVTAYPLVWSRENTQTSALWEAQWIQLALGCTVCSRKWGRGRSGKWTEQPWKIKEDNRRYIYIYCIWTDAKTRLTRSDISKIRRIAVCAMSKPAIPIHKWEEKESERYRMCFECDIWLIPTLQPQMFTCRYAYITHIHIRIYIYDYIRTDTQAVRQTNRHSYMHTYIHDYLLKSHTITNIFICRYISAGMHTDMHTDMSHLNRSHQKSVPNRHNYQMNHPNWAKRSLTRCRR